MPPNKTENDERAVPGHVASTDQLGAAAEAKRLVGHYQQHPQWFGGDEVDEVCTLIDAAVAAERKDNMRLRAALEVVVADWTQQFERAGHLAPGWVKQAREALTPNGAIKRLP